jgi:hypothetical protein
VRRALDRNAQVRGGGQIAKLFYKLSLPVSLQPKAPPILMRPAPLGGELTMRILLLALVVATAASPALAADQIPAAFHGDWCSIAGKDDLYRRGRCPKGVHSIHVTADGYSHEMGNCQVTGLLEARQALRELRQHGGHQGQLPCDAEHRGHSIMRLTLIAAPRVVIRKSSQSVCGCAWTHAISSICGSPASRLARATDQ